MHGAASVTAMPYAVAMECISPGALGRANIDLRGTPFTAPVEQFILGGSAGDGAVSAGATAQELDIRGGGSCGWIQPMPAYVGADGPFNDWGDFYLQLVYTP